MIFSMGPLPEVFAQAAWQRIAQEIDAPASLKVAMQAEVLRLHGKNADQREFIRGMGVVLYRQAWDWPRGRALLAEQLGENPHVTELLEALYRWFTLSTHKLHRRGQIRALLSNGMGHVIRVSAVAQDGQPVPCGAVDQQVLEPSKEVMRRMPPCSHPFCVCSWTLSLTCKEYPERYQGAEQ